ncbi:hypothetical protein [Nostoc commune]|nr:hypothetical protein [Nostoc commune]
MSMHILSKADTTGQNHFRANKIVLWSNIWGDEERLFDLEDELGETHLNY